MRFKDGLEMSRGKHSLSMAALKGIMISSEVYNEMGIYGSRATVTSLLDGRHMQGSKHYTGEAWDLRTWNASKSGQMTDTAKEALAASLRTALGDDYDVVVEKTHIHCEHDPS